jgi:hypothetical protein
MLAWEKRPKVLYLDIKMPAEASGHAAAMTDKIIDVLRDHPIGDMSVVAMVPDLLVLQIMQARAAARESDLKFTWDVEFPAGLILNAWRYSAIDHATSSVHATVASVGRPTAATLFPWRTYRDTISYDIGKWRLVNGDVGKYNAGNRVDWLIAWTINKREEMSCLTRMGVSGIITDEIETLVAVAQAEGRA